MQRVLAAPLHRLPLLPKRMQLDLIDRRHDLGVRFQLVEMLRHEIADPGMVVPLRSSMVEVMSMRPWSHIV